MGWSPCLRCRLTHIGTATVLLEIGRLRLVTDPVFDPPGGRYAFAPGFSTRKLEGPAISPSDLGPVSAVLLSHDQHADNLDRAGRRLLTGAGPVLTTRSGARRLGGDARGLRPWERIELDGGGGRVRITATPARHGPPLSRPFVGEVIGFVLEWPDQRHGALYVSGDTVWFRGVREVGRRFRVGTALLHVGGVRFAATGPLRYTMDGAGAARAARSLGAVQIFPLHHEGWSHIAEGREQTEAAFARAGLGERVRWLERGRPVEVDA